ncbi:hypothetical protein ACHAWF_009923 [Thalassiosira exigua]
MTDAIDPRVLRRFDVCQKVGQGAYGVVWKAVHRRKGFPVALKKCFEAFRCDVDAQRTFREVMYLRALSGHEDVVKVLSVHRADDDRDLYVAFEYVETDLSRVIKARILEPVHIRYVTYQLLRGLKYVHSAGLLHRDVKPSNVLIDAHCSAKLCDFGLCRSVAAGDRPDDLTDYVATRWYRSPEILMGSRRYTEGIDLWSVGCVLGEMFRGRPLLPGASTMGQAERIFELTGNPTASEIRSWGAPLAGEVSENVRARSRVRLDELCPNLPKDAKRLMKRLLKLGLDERGTAESALGHAYVADFHDPAKEPSYPHGPIDIGVDDGTRLSADEYRRKLYQNVKENRRDSGGRLEREVERADSGGDANGADAAVPAAVSYDSLDRRSR